MRHGGPAPAMGLQESVPELRLHLPAGRLLRLGHMSHVLALVLLGVDCVARAWRIQLATWTARSEEHTSELQSQSNLVCRLLLEKNNSSSGARRAMSSAAHPSGPLVAS